MAGVMDFLLGWILQFPLWLGILILALFITIIVNIIHKYTTDQKELKRVRARLKDIQKDMRKFSDNPKKLQKMNAEAMSLNGTYMKMSMRPMLYTFIPIIIIFGWMSANLSYDVVDPGMPVSVQAQLDQAAHVTLSSDSVTIDGDARKETAEQQVSWIVAAGEEGRHVLTFETDDGLTAQHELIVGLQADERIKSQEAPFKTTEIEYPKALPFGSLSIFGYEPGWLATYIIFSIFLNLIVRRLMNLA